MVVIEIPSTQTALALTRESSIEGQAIPDAVVQMLTLYRKDRTNPKESFRDFSTRVGVAYWKEALEPYTPLPPYEQTPEVYRDWGVGTDFSLGGMGPGECAA